MYFALIMLYVGPRLSFHYVWMGAGVFFYFTAWIVEQEIWIRMNMAVRLALTGVIIVGLLLLAAMEIRVLSRMWITPEGPVQYMIVLGACVRGTRVTRSLAYRLKKAASYAEKHPDCMLVVSGGQGPGEDITEAQAMSSYLQKLGIAGERILLEDRSVNTKENLVFSKKVILCHERQKRNRPADQAVLVEEDLTVAICSNNFHMYRAMALAKAAGGWKVYGLAAMTDPFMWLSFTMREGAALFKEILFGHISWK